MNNLESLLSSDDTDNTIIELDSFISELCSFGDDIEKLSQPQKQFYFNQCLEREINNGGFNQYFWNSSGNFAHETLMSLQLTGASTTADILQQAIDQFPNGIVPQDWTNRQEMVEQIEEIANEVWEELDQKFYEYADNLNTLNLDFVKQHIDEF